MTILHYIIGGLLGICIGYIVTLAIQKSLARSRAKNIIDEAGREAEVLKKNKLLEAREEELKIKAEAEKQANSRLSKIQSQEAKIKQRELQLNQQQSENQRQKNEIEAIKANVEAQINANEIRREELEHLIHQARTELEHISGWFRYRHAEPPCHPFERYIVPFRPLCIDISSRKT